MKLFVLGLIGTLLAVGGAHAAPIRVQAGAEPQRVGMGDPIRYVVVARLPKGNGDVPSVRIFADAGPLAQVGPARTTRSTEGSAVVVTLEQHLACLDLSCTPARGIRRVRLPVARVAAGPAGHVVATGRADPVTILVEPRVAAAAVAAATPPYRQQTALSDADGRAGRLVTPLIVAAAVLLLVALLLGMLALRPRSTARAREAELVRAVRLLRESARRPVPDRRRAADLVSRVAGTAGAGEVADDASQLAWSASSPKPEGTVALADRAEAGR
jgi:hypothetical protein